MPYLFSWGRGSSWKIILGMVSAKEDCCLFLISDKRKVLTHSYSTESRQSAIGYRNWMKWYNVSACVS